MNKNKTCNFALKNSNGCICKNSSHGSWDFGYRWSKDNLIQFDDVNYIDKYEDEHSDEHYKYFLNVSNVNNEKNYYINCDCNYCIYSKNKELDNFNECFCCKQKLYIKELMHCSDCNSILCPNCIIQGRYADFEEGTFCYDCRKFGLYKNMYYFTGGHAYLNGDEQWEKATWHY